MLVIFHTANSFVLTLYFASQIEKVDSVQTTHRIHGGSPHLGGISMLKHLTIYFFKFYLLLLFLLYNIVLVLPHINMNPPWVYTCSQSRTPLPPPPPHHPSGSSQCTSPKHPAPCIKPGLAISFLYDIIHVSMPFSKIIPPSPNDNTCSCWDPGLWEEHSHGRCLLICLNTSPWSPCGLCDASAWSLLTAGSLQETAACWVKSKFVAM